MVEEAEGAIVPAAGAVGAPANAFAAAAARAFAGEAPATLRAYADDWRHFCAWSAENRSAPDGPGAVHRPIVSTARRSGCGSPQISARLNAGKAARRPK